MIKPYKNPPIVLVNGMFQTYNNWNYKQINDWQESLNEFLNKYRTPKAKAFNAKLRRGDFDK